MVFKRKEVKKKKKREFVVQIKERVDNKQFADSVTKFIGAKKAKEIYKLLGE